MRFYFRRRCWRPFLIFTGVLLYSAVQLAYFASIPEEYSPRGFSRHARIYNPQCAKEQSDAYPESDPNYTDRAIDFSKYYKTDLRIARVKYHFAINTSPQNFLARRAIRTTWKGDLENPDLTDSLNISTSILFYMGQTGDPKIARQVHKEIELHGDDIVIINFCDNYVSLSLKTYNIMKFVQKQLGKSAEYVIKIDDDVLPNLPIFFDCFPKIESSELGIYGFSSTDFVRRDEIDKYRVSVQRYNSSRFPVFSRGPAYIIKVIHLPALLSAAEATEVLNLEDVWFTGIVAEKAKVTRANIPRFLAGSHPAIEFRNNRHQSSMAALFYHDVKAGDFKRLWRKVNFTMGKFRHCKVFDPISTDIIPTTLASIESFLIGLFIWDRKMS